MPIIIFAIGLFIGSFLNVAILRLNTGRSVVTGRSACARCARTLEWYELIPVLSFLGLRGKCRTCKQPISFQYPVVELLTAIVFVITYTKVLLPGGFNTMSWLTFLTALVAASLLIVILIYDVRHKIIPDQVVYPFILLALGAITYRAITVSSFHWFTALVEGVVVALPFFLLWYFSKGRAMGFGDVKLALGMGWFLGLAAGFAVFLLSFWIGGIIGLFLIGISRKYNLKSQVAFGPFLILAFFIVSIWHITLTSLYPVWPS